MGKRICPPKGPIGLFDYNGIGVEECPKFTYEITVHKYWKGGFCLLGSRICTFDNLLPLKKDTIITKYKNYYIKKEITLIGVPKSFIEENQLNKF